MSSQRKIFVLIFCLLTKSTHSCKNSKRDAFKPVAFSPTSSTSTTTSSTTTTTTTTTTTAMPIPDVPTVLEAVRKDAELFLDWTNGVKMSIKLEEIGDCLLAGDLPWDSEGSVSVSGCKEDDIMVHIESQTYGNWTVGARNQVHI